MLRYRFLICAMAAALPSSAARAQAQPSLDEVVARLARYVSTYGEQASLIVAVEKYQQTVSAAGFSVPMRRQLSAEFVIVRTDGGPGWMGFRDVNEVDGRHVTERNDRLQHLLIGQSVDAAAVTKIANESSRYNVGPTIRNFNVPTTVLFFFHPSSVGRFSFRKVGSGRAAGREVWELAFVETSRPTLIVKRDGTDVPCEGTVWVAPADGTVVRTRLRLQHFADIKAIAELPETGARAMAPPPADSPGIVAGSGTNGTTVGVRPSPPPRQNRYETRRGEVEVASVADIDVSYARVDKYGLWLPATMKEFYEGGIVLTAGTPPWTGRAVTESRYSDFKQFQTSTKLSVPK